MLERPDRRPARGAMAAAAAGVFLSLIAAGCTPWPAVGTGGLAERQETESPHIIVLESRYLALADSGAYRRAAARMYDAGLLLVRARREAAAGLDLDLEATLAAADEVITLVEHDMRRRAPAYRREGAR
jgi:hypothetical protein